MASATNTSSICCSTLSLSLNGKVFFPNSTAYTDSVNSYFAFQQSELHPQCIVSPDTAEDVSTVLSVLTDATSPAHGCQFAVRSGGHAYVKGSSNIEGGVTIDLQNLNSVSVSADNNLVSVGTGATWGSVYSYLDPLELTVTGGRASGVGVGGLTVGGGISYFGPRYGWAFNTVVNFELVLANGTIANANSEENPDLLWALRGGASNFGIVTQVEFQAIEQGNFWGGAVTHDITTSDEQITAFSNFASSKPYDEYASLITSFAYSALAEASFVTNSLEYTKDESSPPIFEPFDKTPNLGSTMRITNMSDLAIETQNLQPPGSRASAATVTIKPTIEALKATVQAWNSTLQNVKDVPGLLYSLSLDPLPSEFYARNAESNSLGLGDRDEDPLAIVLLSCTWTRETDDARIETAARTLIGTIEEEVGKIGALDPFLYVNYAAKWQSPIPTYGKANVDRLIQVAQKYDPDRVFTDQVPGGFKLYD